MKKSDVFNLVLDKIVEVCEVRKESILNGLKVGSVVDARILLVTTLRYLGLSNDDIALITLKNKLNRVPNIDEIKVKSRNVNKLFMMHSERCARSFVFKQMAYDLQVYIKSIENDAKICV